MDDIELETRLESIGKKVFVKCFYIFQRYVAGEILKEQCINEMVAKDPDKTKEGCDICCNIAKPIFEADMECRAIGLICDEWTNTKLSDDTVDKAMAIFQECP